MKVDWLVDQLKNFTYVTFAVVAKPLSLFSNGVFFHLNQFNFSFVSGVISSLKSYVI